MASITVKVTMPGDFRRTLDQAVAFAQKPFAPPIAAKVIAAARSVIAEEFSRGGWLRPAGGFMPWKKGHAFGTYEPPAQPLGSFASRWAGGAGGFARALPGGSGVEIGITHPAAAVHRGGETNVMAGFTIVRPKSGTKMRGWIGANLQLWVSQERLRKGLKIPARPHATDNPKTGKAVAEVVAAAMKGLFN